jgi:hypothetical protein
MPVTFMIIAAADFATTGVKYGSNVQLYRDADGTHLKVKWCANAAYTGRVLKKKHNRTVCDGIFDKVVQQLEKAECRLKLVNAM